MTLTPSARGRGPWWRRAGAGAAVGAAAAASLALLAAWPGGGNALVVALRADAPGPPWAAGWTPADADRAAGARLLASWQCGACHRIEGIAGAQGTQAPALAGLARRSYIAGRLPLTPDLLVLWIVDPPALLPGTAMPALGVPPADARAMAAWLLAPR